MIFLYKPYLPAKSLKYAYDALSSGWISWRGKYLEKLNKKLSKISGCKYVLPVSSGTAATHLVARCLKKRFPKVKKIIAPNSVYVAAWNSFIFNKDFELIIVDADIETWNMDLNLLEKIEKKNDTAILVVHNLGNPINVPKLKQRYIDIPIVEDNCEGFLGWYEGKQTGTDCLCSSVSFFGSKNITCGEGGAFCTNDQELYEYAKLLHSQGQSSELYVHKVLGYNYRMTNIQAALLCGQIEIIDEILEMKKNIFNYYSNKFNQINGVSIQRIEKECIHSNWLFGIKFDYKKNFKYFEEFFRLKGIEVRPFFYSSKKHDHLKNIEIIGGYNADVLSESCVLIPSYPELKKKEMDYIIKSVEELVKKLEIN